MRLLLINCTMPIILNISINYILSLFPAIINIPVEWQQRLVQIKAKSAANVKCFIRPYPCGITVVCISCQ